MKTQNIDDGQGDSLHEKARNLLTQNPQIGKKNLAKLLECSVGMARKLIGRYTRGQRTWSPEEELEVVKKVAATTYRNVAKEYGVSLGKVYAAVRKHRRVFEDELKKVPPPQPQPKPDTEEKLEKLQPGELKDEVKDSTRGLAYFGGRIHTLDELLRCAEVDLSVWYVDRHVINKWEVGARAPTGAILTSPLCQVNAWLRRKVFEEHFANTMKSMWDAFREKAPERHARTYPKSQGGLLEIALFDVHYGRRCWAPETGSDYNLEIAEDLYTTALESLLARASGHNIENIL